MKHNPIEMLLINFRRKVILSVSKFVLKAAPVVLLNLGVTMAVGQSTDNAFDDQGAQVLTRGPVHEAFADIVSYNPAPGVIVEKAPPQAIDEIPPEVRPVGDNISWIPGYWGWDDERSDYLWISGTWRALPPGRQWTSGYWGDSRDGYQWTSGYWADSAVQETVYLPKPPATFEAGPNVAAPSRDYGWTPGTWMWQQERYAWRPGYWAQGRSDWDWIPAHYIWTPRGYVFVDGYWDYSFDRRGVLYAPVRFRSDSYARPGYSYSPVIAIGLISMMEHLFLRPHYHHYYFGDYYDSRYEKSGYYTPYAYQSDRYGYDPVYSYRRWTHRQDQDWDRRMKNSYDYRRDHESARPPRTWADQKNLRSDTVEVREQKLLMAVPLQEMAKWKDHPIQVKKVLEKDRKQLADVGREVRKVRDQRQALEKEGSGSISGKSEREIKPTKTKQLASPIIGRSPERFDKKQAPPAAQNAPAINAGKEKPTREPRPEKARPEPGNRAPDAKKEQADAKVEESPRVKKEQMPPHDKAEVKTPKNQPEPERRREKPQTSPRTEQPPKANEQEREVQPRRPAEKAPVKLPEEAKAKRESKQPKQVEKLPTNKKTDSDPEAFEEKSRNSKRQSPTQTK